MSGFTPSIAIRHSEIGGGGADSYSLISKSAISDTFAELFDEDVARALGSEAMGCTGQNRTLI